MQRDGNLWCETGFAETPATYKGATQTARVLTEGWLAMWGFCPACGADRLPALPNNSPVADFRCAACGEEYELKATRAPLGRKVPDGAFGTMTARLAAANNPSLFVMRYDRTAARVADLIVVPRHFFTPAIIEPRRPLGPTARRAGWQGCNILIGEVPAAGRIALVRAGAPVPKGEVCAAWRATAFVAEAGGSARGWLLAVMRAVEAVAPSTASRSPSPMKGEETVAFTLEAVYAQEAALSALYPGNHNVRAKIRQQLQVLRDRGWLEFTERRGVYRRT